LSGFILGITRTSTT